MSLYTKALMLRERRLIVWQNGGVHRLHGGCRYKYCTWMVEYLLTSMIRCWIPR